MRRLRVIESPVLSVLGWAVLATYAALAGQLFGLPQAYATEPRGTGSAKPWQWVAPPAHLRPCQQPAGSARALFAVDRFRSQRYPGKLPLLREFPLLWKSTPLVVQPVPATDATQQSSNINSIGHGNPISLYGLWRDSDGGLWCGGSCGVGQQCCTISGEGGPAPPPPPPSLPRPRPRPRPQ